MIMLTVLSLNIVGDGLRDALDPRAKARMDAALESRRTAAWPGAQQGAAI